MDAAPLMTRLAEVLDAHAWDTLPDLLHDEFSCRYVHTGEVFDKPGWVRVNAEYPGFEDFELEECVATADRAAGRGRVTTQAGGEQRVFGVASFLVVRDGLIGELVEVWTDVDLHAPEGTRPS